VAEALEADPAFTDASVENGDPALFPEGAAFVIVKDVYEVSDARAAEALVRVRTELVPSALASVGGGELVSGDAGAAGDQGIGLAYVGGEVAGSEDFAQIMNDWFPWVVGGVLLVSFLILMLVFRSLAVPAMTLFVNVLSVAAAYGVLVGVFQFGWGASLGFTQVDSIAPWVPLFLFAVLFGLSMDYHVFLLSRVREAFGVTRDARGSIIVGVRTTGALITGAALIMVAVFAGFASGDVSEMSQMGLGLAVAIILDATLVRVVLVPALLALMGARAWTVPGWLAWLPAFAGEGAADGAEDGRAAEEPELALRAAAAVEAEAAAVAVVTRG
jgi:RND superfamily putative drug exporter